MPQETIEGVIEDIIFYNPDTGYTVLSLVPQGANSVQYNDEITVVGKLLELQPGETVRFTGSWTVHKEYGEQFRADAMHLVTATNASLERYLASGLIEGVGRQTAQQILDHFGEKAMDILDQDPSKIQDVPGIKPNRAKQIADSWAEQRKSRQALIFLQNHGITAALAHKIYEVYGDDTIKELEKDPYQLAVDVEGFGFKAADEIGQAMGKPNDAPERVRAGILFALATLGNDGHVYAPRPMVVDKAVALLGVPSELCDNAITALLKKKLVAHVKKMAAPEGPVEAVYTHEMYDNETRVAAFLHEMIADKTTTLEKAKSLDWTAFFRKQAKKGQVALTDQQKDAVKAALTNKISILTGGPGTGKTTTLRAVIRALDSIEANYVLASPTGRAARRLSDAAGHPASTIHRLLGYSVDGEFFNDRGNPLETDMVVVDEASMLDLGLFTHLLDAMTSNMHLMLVGDVDQLPSVGAGDVLRDVIGSGLAHVTRLDAIFRQANDSLIVVNAHNVNQGKMPDLTNNSSDFFMFGVPDANPGSVVDLLVDVVRNRIPNKFGLDPLNDVQVLAPMYKGDVGIHALNERLQAVLNPTTNEQQISGRTFRIGDKVIQTRNNYEKDVYNGDIGRIVSIDVINQEMDVNIEGRVVTYSWKETGDLYHAFAISIHRSQGGEYPAAVIPVVPQHARMLQRNLLYTAITRAKKLVVLVGTRRAIQMAVENDRVARRYSGLMSHLEKLRTSS